MECVSQPAVHPVKAVHPVTLMPHAKALAIKRQLFRLHRELRSRGLLKKITQVHPSADLGFLEQQYGIAVRPEYQTLSDEDIANKISELERESKRLCMTYIGPSEDDDTGAYDENLLKEIYLEPPESPDPSIPYVQDTDILERARSVVAIVKREALTWSDGEWHLALYQINDLGLNLCSFSRFYGAYVTKVAGTGFLVAPDIIATAGHVDLGDLNDVYFLFDYAMETEGVIRTVFSKDDVYTGAEILAHPNTADQNDWALVKLDREVSGRQPLPYRMEGKISSNEHLYMIGHPFGMPMKYSGTAPVLSNDACHYFTAPLSCYEYNSGSPVFASESHLVEGIMTADIKNYVLMCGGDCNAPPVFEPQFGIPGAFVTRSFLFAWFLEDPSHILVECEIPLGIIESAGEQYSLAENTSTLIPWDKEYQTVKLTHSLDCASTYEVVAGERWEIVMHPFWGMPVMQKVCPE